ncbi:hypothetical protein AAG906_010022 [Vitis piasezkii]
MEDEKFFACWERFREIVAACPHHGFDNWMLVSYFYEAFQFLDYVAEVFRSWDEPIVKEPSRDRTMNRQELVECIPYRGFRCPSKVSNYEKSTEHGVQSCPTLPQARYVYEQANALGTYKQYSSNSPYSNTYNPGWRNHPNLSWEEFLKDLCTVKRRIKLSKKAFLTEQVNAIIENKAMVKYKDPGCPTISVQIGDSFVERALLDLGASVNLLPYSIYKQLGLGELILPLHSL